ncbi:hypothetical protein [Rhodoferax sp. PAMC 29310]|uniref:hypothetical protein n=1 Tax=Rhodoferax sp. PAMC 29310 TaxID=2822760 RepID=UPI001B321C6C|nr:hypothetical protein [Rhodoferax sp. PAMC 29310]
MTQSISTTFVTGGASGIGAAIVRAHAARGDNVAFTYWSSEARPRPSSQSWVSA